MYEGKYSLTQSGLRIKEMRLQGSKNIRGTLRRWLQRLLRNQRGALLAETVVALAVFGVLGSAVLGSVQASNFSKNKFSALSEAENIIRNQLESVFQQTYKAPDDPDPTYLAETVPDGYSVTAKALTYSATSTDIETVRITVTHEGQIVRVFETIRADR